MDRVEEEDAGLYVAAGGSVRNVSSSLMGVALVNAFDALLSSNLRDGNNMDLPMTAEEATAMLERLRAARAAPMRLDEAEEADGEAVETLDVPKFAKAQLEARARLSDIASEIEKKEARRASLDVALEQVNHALQTLSIDGEELAVVMSIARAARDSRVSALGLDVLERERAAFADLVAEGLPLLRAAHEAMLPDADRDAAANNNSPALCPVCYERDVEYALSPCGHTLCATCRGRMLSMSSFNRVGKCHVCRESVHTALRVYLNN